MCGFCLEIGFVRYGIDNMCHGDGIRDDYFEREKHFKLIFEARFWVWVITSK